MRWTTMTLAGILKACSVRCEELCKLSDAIIEGASSVALARQSYIPGVHHFPSPQRGPVALRNQRVQQT